MTAKRDRYYCRDCGAAVADTRGYDAREFGMSVRCPGCGGICDPTAEAVEAIDFYRQRAREQRAGRARHHYFYEREDST